MERSSWCGSRAAAAAALQWQAVDEAFRLSHLPPPLLCSHTSAAFTAAVTVTGSPGRNHSGLSAGGGGGWRGEQGCREAVRSSSSSGRYPAASSAIPAWEQTVVDEVENTPMKLYRLTVNIAASTTHGGMDATVINLSCISNPSITEAWILTMMLF